MTGDTGMRSAVVLGNDSIREMVNYHVGDKGDILLIAAITVMVTAEIGMVTVPRGIRDVGNGDSGGSAGGLDA